MKKLAIIGGGVAALPYLTATKKLNVYSICFGNANDSICKDICDEFVDVSIFDTDKIVEICKEKKVDGVVASSEISTGVTAQIAHELGVLGNRIENGFAGQNKYIMRQRVATLSSVKQPEFSLYSQDTPYTFPLVVKAPDSCGKRGITLVNSQDELTKAVQYAEKYSSSGDVLIEEYLNGGKEYSVECISYKGTHQIIQITQKDSSGPPHFTELGHHQPADLCDSIKNAIQKCTNDILDVLGLTTGPAHLEIKIINGDIYFIEVGARGGGDKISDCLINLSTDFDYYAAAVLAALGQYDYTEAHNTNYAGIFFLCEQSRYLLPLFNAAKSSSWCKECELKKEELKNVSINSQDDMSGYFIYSADRKITLLDSVLRINDFDNAFELLYNHNKEIGRELPDDELRIGLQRFIDNGNVFAMIVDNRIIAMLNLYCNNTDTLEAYINNVYVMPEYRGFNFSSLLVEKAITFTKQQGFKSILLHVAEDNLPAVSVYKKAGFVFTGQQRDSNAEMRLNLI